jgi:hypothetical protein
VIVAAEEDLSRRHELLERAQRVRVRRERGVVDEALQVVRHAVRRALAHAGEPIDQPEAPGEVRRGAAGVGQDEAHVRKNIGVPGGFEKGMPVSSDVLD